ASLEIDASDIPAATVDEPIDAEQLQMAINALPDEFKVVLLMFYFEQHSYRAIAEALEIPQGTVMSRLARAKAHLRRRLQREEPAPVLEQPAARAPQWLAAAGRGTIKQ